MRSSARRTDKYSKKLRALVLPGQTARYAPTAHDRLHLEYCVKKEAITPMLQFSYVAFCEELIKHEANKRPEEGLGIYNKWLNRGLDATLLQSVASCIGVSIEIPAPPTCAWSWKRKLTFTGNVSGTDLDDFPILVHLTVANFDFAKAQNNGEDIRFMDSDLCPTDGTPLKHEIELWDKAGLNAWVWVKVPRMSTGVADFIYMFYGNGVVADGQDPPNVWDAGFKAVLHCKETAGLTLADSTSFSNDFTKRAAGEPNPTTDGQINGAQTWDGNNDYAGRAADPDFDLGNPAAALAIEAWVKSSPQVAVRYLSLHQHASLSDVVGLRSIAAPWDKFNLFIRDRAGVTGNLTQTTQVMDNTYHYFVAIYDDVAHQIRLYRDGVLDGGPAALNLGQLDPNAPQMLGAANMAGGQSFNGKIDEHRITVGTVRTADWILAQFKSMDETLITYGAEQPA